MQDGSHVILNDGVMDFVPRVERAVGKARGVSEDFSEVTARTEEGRVIDPGSLQISNGDACYLFCCDVDTDEHVLKMAFEAKSETNQRRHQSREQNRRVAFGNVSHVYWAMRPGKQIQAGEFWRKLTF